MFDHILLALDEPGDPGVLLPVLRRIARPDRTRVTVMQSAPFLETVMEMPAELSPGSDDESAELFVHSLVEHLRGEGFVVDGFTEIGQNGLIIAAAAERVQASLILLSLRHPSWIRALHRIARVPVLAIPVGPRRSSSNVLVGLENERSLEAIPYAAAMARAFRGGVTFIASEQEALLVQAREAAGREQVPTEATLLSEDVPTTLLTLSAAMIVLRATSEEFLARVVEKARVPLLMVRRPIPLPEPSPPEVAGSESAPLPLASRRRYPSSPIRGFGEP